MPEPPREVMSWDDLGVAARELGEQVLADGYHPGVILGIARGGLLPAGAVAYAIGVKNAFTISVEFYTGIEERLDVPLILPPVPDLIDVSDQRLLIVDDVADTGLHRPRRRREDRGPLREAALDRQVRLRLAPHGPLDHVPVVCGRPARGLSARSSRNGGVRSCSAARAAASPGTPWTAPPGNVAELPR
jgi:hypothetical protein